MPDHLVRALLTPEGPRAVAAVTTEVCREGARRHRLVGAAADALGRVLTGAALMATLTKGEERITVRLTGSGPLAVLTADADARGMLRGFPTWRRTVAQPEVGPTSGAAWTRAFRRRGRDNTNASVNSIPLTVPQLVGTEGRVVILRDLGLKEIYHGQCALSSGQIDQDLEHYLNTSEQLPSIVRCRVRLDPAGQIRYAGGVLIQNMPGGERGLERYQSILGGGLMDRFLTEERTPDDVVSELKGADAGVLEWRQLKFECSCTKTRASRALATCGRSEILDILNQEGSTTLTCHFCNRKWEFGPGELAALAGQLDGEQKG